ncbi:MAG: hypothetical protein Q8K45_10510 [Rubrivivax sp.]|nr:hypothetical protein [Rubrivivax sp.]
MNRAAFASLSAVALLVACGDKVPAPAPAPVPSVPPAVAASASAGSANTVTEALSPSGAADRLPPPAVPPVERDGVRYTQAEDGRDAGHDQVGGVLVASAADSGKRLWTLAVYGNRTDPAQEADVQWVFFTAMAFEPDGRLRIVNEAGKAFWVDVRTRTVTPAP